MFESNANLFQQLLWKQSKEKKVDFLEFQLPVSG